MISVGKVGVGHVAYYIGKAEGRGLEGREGYYMDSGEGPGRWMCAGGTGVDAGGEVSGEALRALFGFVDPASGEALGRPYRIKGEFTDRMGVVRDRQAVSAYDLTFSAPKSLSVLWALGTEAERAELLAAFDDAVCVAERYLQENAVWSRSGHNGVVEEAVPEGAPVARFDHHTSRAGDPQIHAHLLFANRVRCGDGEWRALDGRRLYADVKTASMMGQAALRMSVTRRLGWAWDEVSVDGQADIAGVPVGLKELFSKRSRETARDAARRVARFEEKLGREPTVIERQIMWDQAAVASREAKGIVGLDGDLFDQCRSEVEAAGIGVAGLWGGVGVRVVDEKVPERVSEFGLPWIADPVAGGGLVGGVAGLDGSQVAGVVGVVNPVEAVVSAVVSAAERTSSRLSHSDLVRVVARTVTGSGQSGPGVLVGDVGGDLAALVDELVGHVKDRLVEVDAGVWVSPGLVGGEVAVASFMGQSVSVDEAALARLNVGGLGESQVVAAVGIVGGSTRGMVVVGPAGSGKTTMLAQVVAAVGVDGVVAVAPTAVAAATLGEALGVDAETARKFVYDTDREVPRGGLVIVDEAGQLGTRDLAVICGKAARVGARVVLVGDPAQQASIDAGGLYGGLVDSEVVPVVELVDIHRFDDPGEAAATVLVRGGDLAGLDYHKAQGRIAETTHGEVGVVAASWWEARGGNRGCDVLISAPTIGLVSEVNTVIAARRHAGGYLGEVVAAPAVAAGDAPIRVGDIVVTRRNNRRLVDTAGGWVCNGDRWLVEGRAGFDGVVVQRLGGPERVVLPDIYVDQYLQFAYAITQTRAQSVTVDESLTVVGSGSTLPEFYVGITRGTSGNHVVVVTDESSVDEFAKATTMTVDEVFKTVFSRKGRAGTAGRLASGLVDPVFAGVHLRELAAMSYLAPMPHLVEVDTAAVAAATTRGVVVDRDNSTVDTTVAGAGVGDWLEGLHETDGPDDGFFNDGPDDGSSGPDPGLEAWIADMAAFDTVASALGLERVNVEAAGLIEAASDRFDPLDADSVAKDLADFYEIATLIGREELAERFAALIGGVADPSLADRLDTGAGDGAGRVWASRVRAGLVGDRVEACEDLLVGLDGLRDTIRDRIDDDVAHLDRVVWRAHVMAWVDDGANPTHLSQVWDKANHALIHAITVDEAGQALPVVPELSYPTTTPDRDAVPPVRGLDVTVELVEALDDLVYDRVVERSDHQETLVDVCETVADHYHQELLESPDAQEARTYLYDRGVTDADIGQWGLGWANSSWQTTRDVVGDDDLAVDAGVAGRADSGRTYDLLRDRIVFPIRDRDGATIGFAGRTLDNEADGPKYVNTPATEIYDKSAVLYGLDSVEPGPTVLVEGYLDVIVGRHTNHGDHPVNTVAACGTAVTDTHLGLLAEADPLLLVAFDGDDAGRAAGAKAVATADGDHDLVVWNVVLPDGQDPASLTPNEFSEALATNRRNATTARIDALLTDGKGDETRTYADAAAQLNEVYADDPLLAHLAAHELATRTGTNPDAHHDLIDQTIGQTIDQDVDRDAGRDAGLEALLAQAATVGIDSIADLAALIGMNPTDRQFAAVAGHFLSTTDIYAEIHQQRELDQTRSRDYGMDLGL